MPRYRVYNRISGADFGVWEGHDEMDVLAQVADMGDCVLADESNADLEDHYRLDPAEWIVEALDERGGHAAT
jgi:hypothetical protein